MPFGRRNSGADGRKPLSLEAGAHGAAEMWGISADSLRLTSARFKAELIVHAAALRQSNSEDPPSVPCTFRLPEFEANLTVRRRRALYSAGHSGPLSGDVWWCVDFAAESVKRPGKWFSQRIDSLTEAEWSRLARAFGDGMRTFLSLKPMIFGDEPLDTFNTLHCKGGWIGGRWNSSFFRSSGSYREYPGGRRRGDAIGKELSMQSVLEVTNWVFHDDGHLRLADRRSPDVLYYDGADGLGQSDGGRIFRYEGALGRFVLPVRDRTVELYSHRPVAWEIDYKPALELRTGRARQRNFSRIVGEARLSEVNWLKLSEALVEAFLSWPATVVTGPRPIYLEFLGGYREGAWTSSVPNVVGLNSATTGLDT